MWRVIFSTYKKNRIGIIRAVPWSFMVSRIVTGITQIVFPYSRLGSWMSAGGTLDYFIKV